MRISFHDKPYWHELVERYFDATTSEQEERLLRRYLASNEALQDAAFDEARAVMGIFAARRKPRRDAQDIPRRARITRWRWMAAACIAAIAIVGATQLLAPKKDICVAYVNGERITNHDEVLAMMHQSMESLDMGSEQVDIEQSLTDLFSIME